MEGLSSDNMAKCPALHLVHCSSDTCCACQNPQNNYEEIELTRPLKILVAEDDKINQRLIAGMLKSLGHTCVVVADGDKALKCLATLEFDLVIMDVMMPILGGLEAMTAVRQKEAALGGHLPIVMATAHSEPGDRARFIKAGADGYVIKPIDISQLQTELTEVMG